MGVSPNWATNCLNLPLSRALVNPSAGIWLVGRYLTSKLPFLVSWRTQQLWISTCLNAVWIRIISSLTSLIVCLLSHQMVRSSFSCRRTSRNRRTAAIASLAAVDRPSSSASVEDVVTVNCFPDFYAIGPPNRVSK